MKILCAIAICFIGSFAVAGTPDQDPAVAKLRSEFQKGTIPTNKNLELGHAWTCTNLFADKDDFETFKDTNVEFTKIDGLIEKKEDHITVGCRDGQNTCPEFFARTSQGLSGIATDWNAPVEDTFRVTKGGYLVDEISASAEQAKNLKVTAAEAASNPGRLAVAYEFCVSNPN